MPEFYKKECPIDGPKDLVSHSGTIRGIPRKCSTCTHLKEDPVYKLVYGKDPDVWGDTPRGLDY